MALLLRELTRLSQKIQDSSVSEVVSSWLQLSSDSPEDQNAIVNVAIVGIELFLLVVVLYLMTRTSYNPKQKDAPPKMSAQQEQEVLDAWKPEPLCPASEHKQRNGMEGVVPWNGSGVVVDSISGATATDIKSRKFTNFSSANFLGLASNPAVLQACERTIMKYGVGSCGPRGFYGTIDVHTNFEERVAKFYGTGSAIVYADALACLSSVVQAFSKRGDWLVVDELVNFHIQQGVQLSRAHVHWYKHNDVEDLKRVLTELVAKDTKPGDSTKNRRFIVTEGIFANTGEIAPLKDIVKLKHDFKFRLIVDDSHALGVLGASGKGSLEEHGLDIVEDVEVLAANMDTTLATVGGFCVGDHQVVDHQRLQGLGYCFSASAPPYTVTAGDVGLQLLANQGSVDDQKDSGKPWGLPDKLKKLACVARETLVKALPKSVRVDGTGTLSLTVLGGVCDSPVIHIAAESKGGCDVLEYLRGVSQRCEEKGLLVHVNRVVPQNARPVPPSLRVMITSEHNQKMIANAVPIIVAALKE